MPTVVKRAYLAAWDHSYSFVCVYLSCTTLTADHQGLIRWLQLTPNIPVGFLCHNEDMWLQLLLNDINSYRQDPGGFTD